MMRQPRRIRIWARMIGVHSSTTAENRSRDRDECHVVEYQQPKPSRHLAQRTARQKPHRNLHRKDEAAP